MKYIDSEKLIAEIGRRKKSIDECPFIEAEFGAEMRREGKIQAYNEILSLITSLQQEQPEVELEKEIDVWYNTMGIPVTADALKETARHFYELGLNARKEDTK